MKKLITFLMAFVTISAFAQQQKAGVLYDAVLTRVIDGDTVAFQATGYQIHLKKN